MKTIAICNHKGGAAKTTTAYHLANQLAARHINTLLIDFDPQANLSARWEKCEEPLDIGDALGGAMPPRETLADVAISVDGYLDLAPASFNLANVATGLLSDAVRGRTALARAIRPNAIQERYRVCLVDCPPEAGILLVNALLAADGVLLPAEPEADALAGIAKVVEIIDHIRAEFDRQRPAVLGTIATRVDVRTNRHNDGLATMERSLLAPLRAVVPYRSGVNRDGDLHDAYAPVADFVEVWLGEGESWPY